MIIGIDWLQAFSPVRIHWTQKWIQIPYGPTPVVLQGELPIAAECSVVQLFHVGTDESESFEDPLPAAVQALLDQYQHLFQPPATLPPRHQCDHTIPLLPGAPPVFARPYRYSLVLKSEIENQMNEMLQSGFIRPSTSAFSSPILLMRKKDGNWCFCVDYC